MANVMKWVRDAARETNDKGFIDITPCWLENLDHPLMEELRTMDLGEWAEGHTFWTFDQKRFFHGDGICYLGLSITPSDNLYLNAIRVEETHRGKGIANKVMAILQTLAQKYQMKICLTAMSYDTEPMNTKALKKWYKGLGFKFEVHSNNGVWTPKPTNLTLFLEQGM